MTKNSRILNGNFFSARRSLRFLLTADAVYEPHPATLAPTAMLVVTASGCHPYAPNGCRARATNRCRAPPTKGCLPCPAHEWLPCPHQWLPCPSSQTPRYVPSPSSMHHASHLRAHRSFWPAKRCVRCASTALVSCAKYARSAEGNALTACSLLQRITLPAPSQQEQMVA